MLGKCQRWQSALSDTARALFIDHRLQAIIGRFWYNPARSKPDHPQYSVNRMTFDLDHLSYFLPYFGSFSRLRLTGTSEEAAPRSGLQIYQYPPLRLGLLPLVRQQTWLKWWFFDTFRGWGGALALASVISMAAGLHRWVWPALRADPPPPTDPTIRPGCKHHPQCIQEAIGRP